MALVYSEIPGRNIVGQGRISATKNLFYPISTTSRVPIFHIFRELASICKSIKREVGVGRADKINRKMPKQGLEQTHELEQKLGAGIRD